MFFFSTSFYALGCRFTKWRAVFSVNASELAIEDNVSALSQFAVMSQQRGMVPIVEPEVMVAEGTHCTSSCLYSHVLLLLCCYEAPLPTKHAKTDPSIHEGIERERERENGDAYVRTNDRACVCTYNVMT